jgi:hypothetical protein
MSFYDALGNKIIESIYRISGQTEVGTLNTSTGYISNSDVYNNTRCENLYKVPEGASGKILIKIDNLLSESDTVRVFFFGISGEYISYETYSSTHVEFDMPENARLFKFSISHSASVKRKERFSILSDFQITEVYNLNIINSGIGGSLAFSYEVSANADTSGRLLLPPNYDYEGQKVPLIVFIHGSGSMLTWNSVLGDVMDGSASLSYLPYLQYLANEGFAVFDCYPWTNQKTIPANTHSPFNIPINRQAYLKGITYVCSRFNVDIENVSILCKSQGGHIGQWAITQSIFPFKAVALFAPSAVIGSTMFFNANCREALTQYVDFRGTTEEINAFITSGSKDNELVSSFIEKNKATLASMSPMNQGLTNGTLDDVITGVTTPTNELPQWMIDEGLPARPSGSQPLYALANNGDYVKRGNIPSKYWSAFDDNQSSGYNHYACYHWLANGCSDTEFRKMPTGTGGHHSMDTDANALKSSGTTELGITYTDIPTAYVEAVEFIRSKA